MGLILIPKTLILHTIHETLVECGLDLSNLFRVPKSGSCDEASGRLLEGFAQTVRKLSGKLQVSL